MPRLAPRDVPALSSADAATAPAVEVEHLAKRFGSVVALDDVSLRLPAGGFITFLGPSGCGKTTLLRLIAGLERADGGRIVIGGEDMQRRPAERRPVNMVFQRYALFPHRTVLENVLFGLESARVPRAEARRRALGALAMCRMDGYEDRSVPQLSGGQAQRVAVARALVNDPRVLLLDEPLAALDLQLRRHMQVELRRLQRSLGTTFIYVTHDQEEALALSDLIVLMEGGRVIQAAAPRTLYDEPNCVFAATFIGEANVLDGTVVGADAGLTYLRCAGATLAGRCDESLPAGGVAHLSVRPERVRTGLPETGGVRATVGDVVFQGAAVRYTLHLDAGPTLVAEAEVRPGEALLAPGTVVGATWDPEAARVLRA